MQKFASISFVVASCVIFLVLPFIIITYLNPYFFDAFSRYHVYDNFAPQHRSIEELNARFTHVLSYLQPPFNTTLDSDFFSPEDIIHMHDVQNIFMTLYTIVGIAVIVQIVSVVWWAIQYKREQILQLMDKTERMTGFVLIFTIAVGVLFLATWDRSFILFHQILFPLNTYWQLDPTTSNLIKYLPANIFQELTAIYVLFLGFEYITWKVGTAIYKRAYN